jgi:hypothetical protein
LTRRGFAISLAMRASVAAGDSNLAATFFATDSEYALPVD